MATFRNILFLAVSATVLLTACEAIKCDMCDTLMPMDGMPGYASACPANGQFHPMPCGNARYCLKLVGDYTVKNNGSDKSGTTYTITGEQRNCASDYEIGLFYGEPVDKEMCVSVNRNNISMAKNPDGSIPTLNYTGEVCFCNWDNCNAATSMAISTFALVAGLAIVLSSWSF